jgi:hypothetical protein
MSAVLVKALRLWGLQCYPAPLVAARKNRFASLACQMAEGLLHR